MRRLLFCILLFLPIVLSASCQQRPMMPDEVARAYWNAIKSGNVNQQKDLSLQENASTNDQLTNPLQIRDFKIKRTIIEDQKAIVEVDLELADTTNPNHLPVNTVLIKQDTVWRVDHKTTMASLQSKNEIENAMTALHQFSKQFSKGLDQSFNELERQAPVIRRDIKQLMEQMSARLPGLKQEFEKMIEEIDKAVKPLTKPDTKTPRQPPQPSASGNKP